MKNLCLLLVAVAVAVCGIFPPSADAQLFGNRSSIKINNPGRANDVSIKVNNGRNANAGIANVNFVNGHAGVANVNFVAGHRGANVNFVNGFAVAAPARVNAFGTRTVVTPAGIYEVDAFGRPFFRAPQASFVPATAFGATAYGGFGNALVVPASHGFNVQTFSTGHGFCR